MWYEILPSFGLVYIFITVPHFTGRILNFIGAKRHLSLKYWEHHDQDFHLYLRDRRLTGSEYVQRGLESIGK